MYKTLAFSVGVCSAVGFVSEDGPIKFDLFNTSKFDDLVKFDDVMKGDLFNASKFDLPDLDFKDFGLSPNKTDSSGFFGFKLPSFDAFFGKKEKDGKKEKECVIDPLVIESLELKFESDPEVQLEVVDGFIVSNGTFGDIAFPLAAVGTTEAEILENCNSAIPGAFTEGQIDDVENLDRCVLAIPINLPICDVFILNGTFVNITEVEEAGIPLFLQNPEGDLFGPIDAIIAE
uniref:Uncharacterized protein n=1 Tax=Chromera velia CCMP2878 TaxID=1169474 RepID=A0A0G4HR98_9ALVE|eukprot:Cvel_1289.t1-p1 / transcript=Cvel_1289.t1 / gene=Cvel_1289 / organism=Chromera_velia_CCMP2878 / gene_product=hypothetical protein / transcript_product=hypothetical protein / location=Cvel_scaffold43:104245-104937(-) / protein_length=231 / sequence_SO=supercontig / SO=protein_coding / is_pseudo=false